VVDNTLPGDIRDRKTRDFTAAARVPVYPDNTLPPGIDNTLPGAQPGIDNSLPIHQAAGNRFTWGGGPYRSCCRQKSKCRTEQS
jgi:hypothetical protein